MSRACDGKLIVVSITKNRRQKGVFRTGGQSNEQGNMALLSSVQIS
jgi:hypothetical protein